MIVIGLGNTGEKYILNRHNLGFMVLDRLAQRLGIGWDDDKYTNSDVTKFKNNAIFKPKTYVNNSGQTARQIVEKTGVSPEEIVVVHDDTEIPLGEVRVKFGGSSAGHNGIKSIDQAIGINYWRIRIGIGRPLLDEYDLADYVLSNFTKSEQKILDSIIDRAVDYLVELLSGSTKLATKIFNAK